MPRRKDTCLAAEHEAEGAEPTIEAIRSWYPELASAIEDWQASEDLIEQWDDKYPNDTSNPASTTTKSTTPAPASPVRRSQTSPGQTNPAQQFERHSVVGLHIA